VGVRTVLLLLRLTARPAFAAAHGLDIVLSTFPYGVELRSSLRRGHDGRASDARAPAAGVHPWAGHRVQVVVEVVEVVKAVCEGESLLLAFG
jgi:hypothetical protein